MRGAFLFLVIGLISCAKSKDAREVEKLLTGQWQYEPIAWKGDTVTEMLDTKFDPSMGIRRVVLKTDSGNYQYSYQVDYPDDSLISVEPYQEKWIAEFIFENESSGILYQYTADDLQVGGIHPRLYGETSMFKIITKGFNPKIELIFDANRSYAKMVILGKRPNDGY